jgi:hypothetical protein
VATHRLDWAVAHSFLFFILRLDVVTQPILYFTLYFEHFLGQLWAIALILENHELTGPDGRVGTQKYWTVGLLGQVISIICNFMSYIRFPGRAMSLADGIATTNYCLLPSTTGIPVEPILESRFEHVYIPPAGQDPFVGATLIDLVIASSACSEINPPWHERRCLCILTKSVNIFRETTTSLPIISRPRPYPPLRGLQDESTRGLQWLLSHTQFLQLDLRLPLQLHTFLALEMKMRQHLYSGNRLLSQMRKLILHILPPSGDTMLIPLGMRRPLSDQTSLPTGSQI